MSAGSAMPQQSSGSAADSPALDPTADLMNLVGVAIDTWVERHGMQNLPRDIVLQQALLALNQLASVMRTGAPAEERPR